MASILTYVSRDGRRSVLQELSGLDASVQNAVCLTLWHGINWIRSILNFFAYEKTEYYAAKVAERLENLSLLESILLDEALPACLSFQPPGSASSPSTAAAMTGADTVKSAGDGKKKPGRPPGKKRVSSLDDRKLAVQQSFVPLKPEVVSVLTSPRLQPRTGVSMDPLSQDAASSELEVPLIQILFALLEHHVQRSCNDEKKRKTAPGFWTKAASSAFDDVLVHESDAQTAQELLDGFFKSGVLNAAGQFAAHILSITERDQRRLSADAEGNGDGGVPSDTADHSALETQLDECKRVLIAYLRVVAAVIAHDVSSCDASAAEDDGPDPHRVQRLQALLLPQDDRIEYVASDATAFQQVRPRLQAIHCLLAGPSAS